MLRLAAAAVLLTAAPALAQRVPLMWEATGAAGRVTLLGSIHLLTPADYPLAAPVEAAFAGARVVAFEIDLGDASADDPFDAFMTYGTYAGGRTLRDALPDSVYAALDDLLSGFGQGVEDVERFRPWAVEFYLDGLAPPPAGLDAALGVDQHLYDRAVAEGRETVALETVSDQIAALSGTPEPDQVASLARALGLGRARTSATMDVTADLWRDGDAAGLAQMLKRELAATPASLKGLLGRRNRAWLPALEALLARGEPALVVVGAAHLVGPDNLVDLLRQRGYAVERVGL